VGDKGLEPLTYCV